MFVWWLTIVWYKCHPGLRFATWTWTNNFTWMHESNLHTLTPWPNCNNLGPSFSYSLIAERLSAMFWHRHCHAVFKTGFNSCWIMFTHDHLHEVDVSSFPGTRTFPWLSVFDTLRPITLLRSQLFGEGVIPTSSSLFTDNLTWLVTTDWSRYHPDWLSTVHNCTCLHC